MYRLWNIIWRQFRVIVVFVSLLVGGIFGVQVINSQEDGLASSKDLASHYAPVIMQSAADSQDYITAVDFDGDWIGSNNWENQPLFSLKAVLYYDVKETDSHFFITYGVFHPRDWFVGGQEACLKVDDCHENDFEYLQVIGLKNDKKFGEFLGFSTIAHNDLYIYKVDDRLQPAALPILKPSRIEASSHPVVWIEAYGHGIFGRPPLATYPAAGLVEYRLGEESQEPQDIYDNRVSYVLVSMDELWQRRQEIGDGKLFDGMFTHSIYGALPGVLDGENFAGDIASAPWGTTQGNVDGGSLEQGDWFLDPMKAFLYHVDWSGEVADEYVVHDQK